jgi:hypothetical protein
MLATWEVWIVRRGLIALVLVAGLRYLAPMLLFHGRWLLDTQLIFTLLLWSALLLVGCLVGGSSGRALGFTLGLLAWGGALSMIPRFAWHIPAERPLWQQWASLGLLLGALILRRWLLLRWSLELTGQGWDAIQAWAVERPFQARALAQARLKLLGWKG